MKKILLILLILSTFNSYSQVYQKIATWYEYNKFKVTGRLGVPNDTAANAEPNSIAIINGKLYFKPETGSWTRSGGNVSVSKNLDSLIFMIDGQRFAFKDSTGGGGTQFPGKTLTDTITGDPNKIPTDEAVFKKVIAASNPDWINITLASLDASSNLNTSKIYWVTDGERSGPFQWIGTGANQTGDNGGTVIINASNQIFKRIYNGAIDPRWFGATADGTSKVSPGSDDGPAINAALAAAAGQEEKVELNAYNEKGFNIGTKVKLLGGSFLVGGKSLTINANLYGTADTCFIIDGFKHYFKHRGQLFGPNSGAADSTAYTSYTGTGVYIRNANDCLIDLDRIVDFKYNIRIGGENVNASTEGGSQYCKIFFTQSRSAYVNLWYTLRGTPSNGRSNWANANEVKGRLGGGIGIAGGVFGLKMEKIDGSSTSKFEANKFYLDIEGVYWGAYLEFAKQNNFIGTRIEDGAVTKKFYFRQDNTNNLSAPNNRVLFTYAYESWWEQGGLADGTMFIGSMYTASTSEVSYFSVARGGKWNHRNNNDPATGLSETLGNVLMDDNFDGIGLDRWAFIIKRNGRYLYVPFLYEDTVVTASTFTVPLSHDMVYINREASQALITLPSPGARNKDVITLRNVAAGQSVKINTVNLAPGDDSIITARNAYGLKSDGTYWYIIYKTTGGSGGSGGGDVYSITTASTENEFALFSGTTGKVLKRMIGGTGFLKSTSGTASVQAKINMADLNATGTANSANVLYGDGRWAAPPAGGSGSNPWQTGNSSSIYYSLGSVNVGVNPSTPYALMHFGPTGGTTKALFEFDATSTVPTAMRIHSIAYDAACGCLKIKNASGVVEKILSENLDAIFTGRFQGADIHPDYIWDGSAPAGSILISNGVNGSLYSYNIGAQGQTTTNSGIFKSVGPTGVGIQLSNNTLGAFNLVGSTTLNISSPVSIAGNLSVTGLSLTASNASFTGVTNVAGLNMASAIATDASFNLNTINETVIILPQVTANRTVTLNSGGLKVLINENTGASKWNVSGTLRNKTGSLVTTLTDDTVYWIQFISDLNEYRIIMQY